MGRIVKFHERLKGACYYKNVSAFEAVEKIFDGLIEELKVLILLFHSVPEIRIKKYLKNRMFILII